MVNGEELTFLQEYKMRTYISVWEKDKYIPRFMCDDAKWRLSLKEIVSGYRLKNTRRIRRINAKVWIVA